MVMCCRIPSRLEDALLSLVFAIFQIIRAVCSTSVSNDLRGYGSNHVPWRAITTSKLHSKPPDSLARYPRKNHAQFPRPKLHDLNGAYCPKVIGISGSGCRPSITIRSQVLCDLVKKDLTILAAMTRLVTRPVGTTISPWPPDLGRASVSTASSLVARNYFIVVTIVEANDHWAQFL
ncbi:hypothetical protein JAAARDRAFT_296224 [Jaapia argillacea MUCL 33604]|uniref:Uncharacterized protein n=1 Tax=Jaapia argillacea MUCL 33604 TaxID=933084 RepID=A0A067PPA9_9AGAM|nr:hypothetical protein JAAARDRAFT_296224 [Jaapia argillacea MUCL 33604]